MDRMMQEMAAAAKVASSSATDAGSSGVAGMFKGMAAGVDGDQDKTVAEMSKMWDYMNSLMESDPKAYGKFLEEQQFESAKSEAQGALSEQLGNKPGVFPEPGIAIKLFTSSTSLLGAPVRKTFVNIAQLAVVQPPMLPSNEPVVDKAGKEHPLAQSQAGSATVSMAVGHVRAMNDNKGVPALVVDVNVHPWTISQAKRDKAFHKGLVDLVRSDVLPELGWKLEPDPETGATAPVEIRAKYKGGMPVPGFKNRLVTMKFLVNEADRPANKNHADCLPTELPEEEAGKRAKEATGQAIKLAATAAGGEEARGAVEAAEGAKEAAAAASRTAERMRSPESFLAQARAGQEADVLGAPSASSSAAQGRKPLIAVVDETAEVVVDDEEASTRHDEEQVDGLPAGAPATAAADEPSSAAPSRSPSPAAAAAAAAAAAPAPAPAPAPGGGRGLQGVSISAEACPSCECIDLILEGFGALDEGSDLSYTVSQGCTVKLRMPGRAKRIKVPVPKALLGQAAGRRAAGLVLSASGGRIIHTGGRVCFRVPVVPAA